MTTLTTRGAPQPPLSLLRRPLPPAAVGDLLMRAAQAGLPLRLALHAGGVVLVREACCFVRLVFDGFALRAEAGADALCLDEARSAVAWCLAEGGRTGLHHRVELHGGGWRLEIGEPEAAGRPESCAWRQLVQSLSEEAVHG